MASVTPEPLGKCPICGKASEEKFRPFCSSRCALVDLGQWLGEGYALPALDDDEEDEPFLPDDGGEKG